MMDASVLRLVPRSVILSSQERGKMAVIQYEKACTNSYLNLISIRLQGHNVITKGPRLQSQIEETTPIRSPNKYRLLLHLFEKAFDQLKESPPLTKLFDPTIASMAMVEKQFDSLLALNRVRSRPVASP
ncbi:hypothetical protein ACOSQ2_003177 [Xanthoceras sorbifolium]